jgi:OPT oligopeptide transporter protein
LGVIRATTGQQILLNVLTELIIGYIHPGRPIAMMLFKTWGYNIVLQTLNFTSDLKLAYYMKIAHRPIFFCQVVATIVAGTVQLGVQAWMFSNIEDFCSADQKDGFICPQTYLFGNASIIVSRADTQFWFPWLTAVGCDVVGCHWAAAPVLAQSTLLRPHYLLPCRHPCTVVPVDVAQEVQNRFSQVHPLSAHLHWLVLFASCVVHQLCDHLLYLQLYRPSTRL